MVLREPKDASLFQGILDSYYSSIFGNDEIGGAILMGVCRGRISEGLDFSDNAARCVIIAGVPFPMITDPKLILKEYYLDQRSHNKNCPIQLKLLTGKKWY